MDPKYQVKTFRKHYAGLPAVGACKYVRKNPQNVRCQASQLVGFERGFKNEDQCRKICDQNAKCNYMVFWNDNSYGLCQLCKTKPFTKINVSTQYTTVVFQKACNGEEVSVAEEEAFTFDSRFVIFAALLLLSGAGYVLVKRRNDTKYYEILPDDKNEAVEMIEEIELQQE